jgi:hypothetical protein
MLPGMPVRDIQYLYHNRFDVKQKCFASDAMAGEILIDQGRQDQGREEHVWLRSVNLKSEQAVSPCRILP